MKGHEPDPMGSPRPVILLSNQYTAAQNIVHYRSARKLMHEIKQEKLDDSEAFVGRHIFSVFLERWMAELPEQGQNNR
jgi:hypothetical protein